MQEKPKVSVIMPHYKIPDSGDEYIEDALKSLENQTTKDFEVCLCLDNPEMEYLFYGVYLTKKYKNLKINLSVKLDKEPNVSVARNIAMLTAKGEWFCFIDSDNTVNTNFIDVMYCLARDYYSTIPICSAFSLKKWVKEPTAEPPISSLNKKNYHTGICVNPLLGQIMVNRKHLEKVGFFFDPELKIYESSLMVSKLAKYFKFQYNPTTYIDCRIWEGTLSSRFQNVQNEPSLEEYDMLVKKKVEEYWDKNE